MNFHILYIRRIVYINVFYLFDKENSSLDRYTPEARSGHIHRLNPEPFPASLCPRSERHGFG